MTLELFANLSRAVTLIPALSLILSTPNSIPLNPIIHTMNKVLQEYESEVETLRNHMLALVSLAQTLVFPTQKHRNDQLKEKFFQVAQQAEVNSAELRVQVQALEAENRQLRDQLRKTGANLTVTSVDARLMGETDGATVEVGERGRRTNSRTDRSTPMQGASPARSRHTATPDNPPIRRESEDASDHISEQVESSIQDLGDSVASEESAKAEV